MTVEGIACDWEVKSITSKASIMAWGKQATGPMPLEAIHYLINLAVTKQKNILIGAKTSNFVYVTKEFFQANPLGIKEADVKDDVLGFFSLILTYAKSAPKLEQAGALKALSSIMPRTNFLMMYKLVQSGLKPYLKKQGDLYTLVKYLACWENDYDHDEKKLHTVAVSHGFCKLQNGKMVPTEEIFRDEMKFTYKFKGAKSENVSIKDWIDNLQALEKDSLEEDLDTWMWAQFGGLEQKTEYVVGTQRPVPIFEFRDLGSSTAATMEKDVKEIENAFLELHKKFKTAPTAFTKWWKRAVGGEVFTGIGGHMERREA
ncbi:hypothetical protein VPNG_01972 [Cytospora leucostoma]|uniref:Uncharacterized protein n=1 Tax=Cytospora leucostoma TaxID=1230097 RepID=A0A423XJB0_9PEZI|nr:hypothetical protein VPNG_01972 [Cytospora leucostoma]